MVEYARQAPRNDVPTGGHRCLHGLPIQGVPNFCLSLPYFYAFAYGDVSNLSISRCNASGATKLTFAEMQPAPIEAITIARQQPLADQQIQRGFDGNILKCANVNG